MNFHILLDPIIVEYFTNHQNVSENENLALDIKVVGSKFGF